MADYEDRRVAEKIAALEAAVRHHHGEAAPERVVRTAQRFLQFLNTGA